MRKLILFPILIMLTVTFVSASFFSWIQELFSITGNVVVDVNGQKDYCPEVKAIEDKVNDFETQARNVLKNANSCLDDADCNLGGICQEVQGTFKCTYLADELGGVAR